MARSEFSGNPSLLSIRPRVIDPPTTRLSRDFLDLRAEPPPLLLPPRVWTGGDPETEGELGLPLRLVDSSSSRFLLPPDPIFTDMLQGRGGKKEKGKSGEVREGMKKERR